MCVCATSRLKDDSGCAPVHRAAYLGLLAVLDVLLELQPGGSRESVGVRTSYIVGASRCARLQSADALRIDVPTPGVLFRCCC